ncbi:MAG TPA: protoporphyrinogen oxidase, partial [Thermoanaerobaculia bacterium]|nr:protoporphyrinogen oxidase [Thermoanaerobaculia bacterium]
VESVQSDDRAGGASPSPTARRWAVRTAKGEVRADKVILAAPAWEAARLVREFAPEAAEALGAIPHPFLAVAHVSLPLSCLPAPLHGFGHLVVPQEGRRILGAVWSSSLFEGRAPAGTGLVTVFLGGSRDPEAARMSDAELSRIAVKDLAAALGAGEQPRVVSLTRYARSIPQYTAGHLARIAVLEKTESAFPGLSFIGNYRGGVSVGDVVKNALTI